MSRKALFTSTFRAALLWAGLASSCGTAWAADVVPAARNALPEATRSSGMLRVATSLEWPPFGYQDEKGKSVGIDIALVDLLAGKLGLRPEVTDVKFPAIVPGVSTGRFDIGLNQITITAERAKVVQFVAYFRSKEGLLVRQGVADIDINHICGHTLALTQGSSQIALAETLSKECVAKQQKAIGFLFYPNSADTYLAVANGRGDGFLTGSAAGVYIAKQNNKLFMSAARLEDQDIINGIVVGKDNNALQTALVLALQSAIQDGSYGAILKEFGVTDSALTADEVAHPPQH